MNIATWVKIEFWVYLISPFKLQSDQRLSEAVKPHNCNCHLTQTNWAERLQATVTFLRKVFTDQAVMHHIL